MPLSKLKQIKNVQYYTLGKFKSIINKLNKSFKNKNNQNKSQ
jgi:hypothetical protein